MKNKVAMVMLAAMVFMPVYLKWPFYDAIWNRLKELVQSDSMTLFLCSFLALGCAGIWALSARETPGLVAIKVFFAPALAMAACAAIDYAIYAAWTIDDRLTLIDATLIGLGCSMTFYVAGFIAFWEARAIHKTWFGVSFGVVYLIIGRAQNPSFSLDQILAVPAATFAIILATVIMKRYFLRTTA